MASEKPFFCCKVRAGPLVKECRARRAAFGAGGVPHNDMLRCAVCRDPTDRAELYLALLGWEGSMHTLTFADDALPRNYKELQRTWRAFMRRVRRWRDGKPLDVLCAPEGRHGEARYHIHMCCRDSDLSPAEVRHLWTAGPVEHDEPIILDRRFFRRVAVYVTKEREDGEVLPVGRHPYTVSRSLSAQMPKPERWRDDSLAITPPDGAIAVRRAVKDDGSFGAYYYGQWIEPDGTPYCKRACARARPYL